MHYQALVYENDRFNTQPPEGGWEFFNADDVALKLFQHTAARRRLGHAQTAKPADDGGFNTQPPEGGWKLITSVLMTVAGFQHTAARRRLGYITPFLMVKLGFNTQPPEGGWNANRRYSIRCNVSTHSRPKAAGRFGTNQRAGQEVSTHSRPKAAGAWSHIRQKLVMVSTHSRPKAAGGSTAKWRFLIIRFNTQPPEGGWSCSYCITVWIALFQHTAARRRLEAELTTPQRPTAVSTHSRPKAAGPTSDVLRLHGRSFNTQPPEGGWRLTTMSYHR